MTMRKYTVYFLTLMFALSGCQSTERKTTVDELAAEYVRLGLEIGEYDPVFVDAYYGPDSLKYTGEVADIFPADQFRERVALLKSRLKNIEEDNAYSTDDKIRAGWISSQLTAFDRRIRIFNGELGTFDEEALELYGVNIPKYDSTFFIDLIQEFDSALPGKGSLKERYDALAQRFVIPEDKMDTVFQVAIEEARKITLERFDLPAEESFVLEYVKDKSWSGYNWYQGGYQSLIQINIDHPIRVDRVIDLACHEGYPGHHVYNLMLEKNLYVDKGWVEISLYPLFSPQSLIAEGSANYGIDMAFPGQRFQQYCSDVLIPLAGLDTTGIAAYFKCMKIKEKLSYARNEAARGMFDGSMSEDQINHWLEDFALTSTSVPFINKYRTYIVNYNYGKDLVKEYIEFQSDTDEDRWQPFGTLLSSPIRPKDMLAEVE